MWLPCRPDCFHPRERGGDQRLVEVVLEEDTYY